MSEHRTLKFDGKTYRFYSRCLTKPRAVAIAKKIREQGDYARVVRDGVDWLIYKRNFGAR